MMAKRRLAHLMLWLAASLAASGTAQAITLDEALAAAIAHTPDIAAADADADVAKARLEQAKAGGLPTATVSGTIGYGRLDPRGFFGLGAANVTPRSAQLTVEQPLFTGGRVRAGIDQARAGIAGAEAGQTGMRSQLVMAVTQAYGDVLTAARMVDLYGRLVTQTTEIERQARLKFRAGESPSTDVSQAVARLAEARAGLARAQGMQVSAKAHFRNLTGLEPLDLQPLPANPVLPATLDEAMDTAIRNNPALAQSEASLRGAQAAARGARAERLPTVGAFAEGATVRDQFFPDYRADSATVGIRARWELFSGGRVSGKVAETNSRVRAADARARAMRSQVEEQVISAFQDVRTAQLVEQAASDQAAAAIQALDSVTHEVRVGIKPQLDLLDAERESIAAQAGAARAATDRIVAAYRLLSLLGRY
ncbi:type I secretion outer membrane protein, TolC family [Sphingobium indicum BiD32]|uniref:Type I secretion outer membrane protein, TolC family n=1 Tax=Sphingobium indicum BiD32 TaxID=1301087 RepID=N1MP78_9SPHN|nr:TolC family protein [Sphingobium indicum]CCW18549.1 type I secretion outer membrane protein, TolC family [Sphingobium indicum BiD32]